MEEVLPPSHVSQEAPEPSLITIWQRMKVVAVILLCMVGVTALSLFVLDRLSLRLDEAQSLWQTSHSINGTLRVVAQDVHVPLYHLILHFWQVYFGHNLTIVRLPSLIFFLLTIPVFYLLARQVMSWRWSLFATVVFSFLPFMDWYSTEARMYTLLGLMATLSQYYFIRILQHRKGWLGYGVTALIGAFSHYFFMFNLATQALYYFMNKKRFVPGDFKRFVTVAVLVIMALGPWLFYFFSLGAGKNTSPHLTRPSTVDFFNAFSQFIFGFQNNYVNTLLLSSWSLIVLLAFFAVKRGQRLSPELSYIVTAAFVPVVMAYVLSFIHEPFFLSRYMISSVPPLLILIVWFISNYRRRPAMVASIVLAILIVITSYRQITSAATPVKENYQAVAESVKARATSSDIIVMSAPFTVYPFEYYYNGNTQIATLPTWNRQSPGAIPAFNPATLPAEVKQLSAHHQYTYLILSQNQGYENQIKQYYLHHYKLVSHTTYSPDLELYVFQVGYYTVPAIGSPKTLIQTSQNTTVP